MTFELLTAALRLRLDAFVLGLIVAGFCWASHRFVTRREAQAHWPRGAWAMAGLLAVAGAGMSEWLNLLAGGSDDIAVTALALAHVTVLTLAALVIGLGLAAAARYAVLQAQLQAHDIAERTLEQAREAADQASRAKSDFLAVMSHEIRTPLNAVMGFASLLSETRLDEAQRGYLTTITNEGARLTALINDILDLTKMEQGRLALERLPFAPAEVAHEVLRLFSAKALEKEIELRFEAQIAGPLLVAGDPLRFRQVLVNLVHNAVKFTPRGTVTLFLTWTPPTDPGETGELLVCVRDTGIGIPPEKIPHLFHMFMQVDSSTTRRYGGTGLGLAICERLVALMGGNIAASSDGEGSEFSFALPLRPVAAPLDIDPPETVPQTCAARPRRILIVDDMETNRFLLEVFLRRNGFEPEVASGGAEAVRLAALHRYDAILMDLQMPDLDGFTAARQIRRQETAGQHTPIIALTATIGKGTRDRCLAAGMDEHLTKPLDLRRFKTLLEKYLTQSPASPATEAMSVGAS